MIRYKGSGCKWWHFYPQETYADLRSKFQEIINGQAESPLLNEVIQGVKNLQLKTLGQELF